MNKSCGGNLNQNVIAPYTKGILVPNGQFRVTDIPIKLPGNFTKVMLTDMSLILTQGTGAPDGPPQSDFMSFIAISPSPLGLAAYDEQFTTPEPFIDGTKPWILLWQVQNSSKEIAAIIGTIIEFENPVNVLYLHLGLQTSNVFYNFTFAGVDNAIKRIYWNDQGQG